ncbi:MAG: hypothetical protein IT180_05220 [Acidobacteria bacterium]|nr:hypothetical protein [Acidobacteriota bacterium]HQZ38144.1 hypothetical protein [Vicinamibacterales bacterium]
MTTIIKIALAAVLLTATVQAGRAAIKHYAFVDEVQESLIFASSRNEQQVADRVLEIAAAHAIPLDPENLAVRREAFLIEVNAPYTDTVNLLPGFFTYPWNFEASASVRLLEDTRPRGVAPRGKRR